MGHKENIIKLEKIKTELDEKEKEIKQLKNVINEKDQNLNNIQNEININNNKQKLDKDEEITQLNIKIKGLEQEIIKLKKSDNIPKNNNENTELKSEFDKDLKNIPIEKDINYNENKHDLKYEDDINN